MKTVAGSCFAYYAVFVYAGCRLLSRSDIFKPLFKEDYEEYMKKEKVSANSVRLFAVLTADSLQPKPAWKVVCA